MAIREDGALSGGAYSVPRFQNAPPPVFAPQSRQYAPQGFGSQGYSQSMQYSPQGFASQGYSPQGFAPQGSYAMGNLVPDMQSAPARSSLRKGNQSQGQEPQLQSGRQMEARQPSWQPQQPLEGPWIANEPNAEPVKPAFTKSKKQSFWSKEDTILKREQAAQHLCHLKEEILEQRITFLENILFRSMDLPAHDVKYAQEMVEEEKTDEAIKAAKAKEEKDKHDHDFQRHYVGPWPPSTENNPENGFFVDVLRAVRDYPMHEERAEEHERFRRNHWALSALAGDWRYFKNADIEGTYFM